MKYNVHLHPKAADSLKSLDKLIKNRVKKRLNLLKEKPEAFGKRLKYSPFWSLRIGDYRAIYEINNKEKKIIILFIGHRKNVYTDFEKIF